MWPDLGLNTEFRILGRRRGNDNSYMLPGNASCERPMWARPHTEGCLHDSPTLSESLVVAIDVSISLFRYVELQAH